ncbi:MAG TPA: hypothetical protein VG838_12125 [Opitutaceae bacterium]|nr:hypothetical protein [Opitutaceae bacterium]
MRKAFPPLALLFAALFSLAASLPFLTTTKAQVGYYFFEAELSSSVPAMVQLFYDVGRGSIEADSVSLPMTGEKDAKPYRFPLPMGTLHALRFDPIDREGTVTIARARIVDRSGRVLHAFSGSDFHGYQQIASLTEEGGRLKAVTTPGAFDPILQVALDRPLTLGMSWGLLLRMLVPVWLGVGGATLLISALFSVGPRETGRRLAGWASAHPVRALLGTAAIATAVQCYPVVFLGRSFVSPNNAVYLLYDTYPTAPGYQNTELEDARGADVGAMMWQHMYYPAIAGEAVFSHGELPLWNRYDLCGVPLLGQGQSMFGDPLNWLTMVTKGATWSWDLRFLAMRVLFAFGTGLLVWMLARHLGAALLVTLGIGYIGFFAFRLNHAAILSVCWSPWVLVAWCWLLEARTPRARNVGGLALVLAHLCMMTSGTIKEAYMLAACLDLAGALLLLTAAEPWRARAGRLATAAVAGVVFVLLAAPQWITFLDALRKSHTNYDIPSAAQISPWLLIGFFEDLFYRQLRPNEGHFDPSSNFVILFGVLWALAGLREIASNRRGAAVLGASLVPLALVFGVVPSEWIVKLPFIANISHVDNTFSCPLLVLTAVLAGFGLAAAIRGLREPGWLARHGLVALLLAGLAALYFGSTQQAAKSAFFAGYVSTLFLVVLAAPAGAWLAVRRGQPGAAAAIVAVGLALLLWRHGEYVSTPFDTYVFNPQVRVDLKAPSPAVGFVNARRTEPARTVGLGYNLFPGYNQNLDWESIYGVDAVRNKYLDQLADATPMRKITDWVGGPPQQDDIGPALPMQDLMNVRYYLASHRPTPHEIPGRTPLARLDLDVYESPTAWPRAFFTDALTSYGSTAEFVRLTMSQGGHPFAAVQESDVPSLPSGARALSRDLRARSSAAAHDYQLTDNTTRFIVAASAPGVIVLSESYYPGDFEVTLDGEPAEYFRVNHAFKGVYVSRPGTYHVTFRYWPEHLTLGLWLFFAGVILGIGAPVADWQWRRLRPA